MRNPSSPTRTITCMPSVKMMFSFTALLSISLMLGCGSSGRLSISGDVTLDGQPVPKATLSFVAQSGTDSPTGMGSVEDGTFNIDSTMGVKPGNFRVTLRMPPGERSGPMEPLTPVKDPANFDLGAAMEKAKANAPKPGKTYLLDVNIKGSANNLKLDFATPEGEEDE